MSRNRPVSLALIGLFVWLTACTSYKQIELTEVADHGTVRVTMMDGERETLREPRVETDSIKGRDEAAVPLEDVAELEAVSSSAALGILVLVLGAAVLVGLASPPLE